MENSSFGRVLSVLTSPTATFRSIAERPTWLVPILVLIVLGLISTLVAAPKIDWEETLRTRLEQSGRQVPAEQIEAQVEVMEKFGKVMIYVAAAVFPWIVYPLMARIFLGLFRVAGSELSFLTSLSVLLYGFMPWAVATLLGIPVMLTQDSIAAERLDAGGLMSNLAVFAGDEVGPAVGSLLASVDLFSLWTIALLVIGYAIAAKVSKGRSAAIVVGLRLVFIVGKAGLAGLEQMLGS